MASDASPFGTLMPGFEFLQELVKNAGAAAPGIGQWVAPTLNPEEIQKRIDELKTVQFWLEQNARMIGATIQALEVQRMTLSTLKTMNVQMTDLRDALTIRMPGGAPVAAASPAPAAPPAQKKPTFAMPSMAPPPAAAAPVAAASAARSPERPEGKGADSGERAAAPPGGAAARPAVDPMQWWGALTKQFTELAASALRDTAAAGSKLAASSVASAKRAAAVAAKSVASADQRPAAAGKKAAAARRPAPRRDGTA